MTTGRRPALPAAAVRPRRRGSTHPTATQGGRRAGGIGDPAVAAAEHQDLDELVEHQPVANAPSVAAQRWWMWRTGSRAANWTHNGSRTDDGRAGTRPPCDRRWESPVIITARACRIPLRPTGAGPKSACLGRTADRPPTGQEST
jgi:hypothetical protein